MVVLRDVVAGIPSFAMDDGFVANRARILMMTAAIVMATFPEELGFLRPSNAILHKVCGYRHRKRARKFVKDMFQELGPCSVGGAHRMPEEDFWTLLSILQAHLQPKQLPRKKHKNGAQNGLITPAMRFSCALRYFAGGRPENIALVHGVSHTEVFVSVWRVVDAVNKRDKLSFEFPEDHKKQRGVARGFLSNAKGPKFDCCVGAIDGMLIWTEKPTDQSCEIAKCGSRTFFCRRKHKHGLNM